MSRLDMVSVSGGIAKRYLDLKKPSKYLPLRGKFPVLDEVEYAVYCNRIKEVEKVSDLPDKYQRATQIGIRIGDLENGFLSYLKKTPNTPKEYLSMNNTDKSNLLYEWMRNENIDIQQLTFKM